MEAQLKNTDSVGAAPLGRWRWSDETQRMEFVSCRAEEEDALRRRSQPDTDFLELQLRAEWLAGVYATNHGGRHTRVSRMGTTELETFRTSLMEQQGETVTVQDVKQVAVSLLQDNHTPPIPACFLDILRSRELDDVITALLLYLSCFLELEPETPAASEGSVSEKVASDQQKNIWSKLQGAQRKLAISYFSLMTEKHPQNPRIHKCFNKTESLLDASLYSFLCCVAWVAFRRTHMKEIQHEVGRLLYSDTFNAAIKEKMNEESEGTSAVASASQRTTLDLSHVASQRSPLMICLLPSPKDRSPHLFSRSRGRSHGSPWTNLCSSRALMEQSKERPASSSSSILGKPLSQFCRSSLRPLEERMETQ
uniref:Protein phosphatase 1 regulatory subunit 36 n=1 Tax=Oryzias melastigma TaxID=30732 RepID=A0A3B3BKH5_ORYME